MEGLPPPLKLRHNTANSFENQNQSNENREIKKAHNALQRQKAAENAKWARWEEEEENVWEVPLNLVNSNTPYSNLNIFNRPETPKVQPIKSVEPMAPKRPVLIRRNISNNNLPPQITRKRGINHENRNNYKRGKVPNSRKTRKSQKSRKSRK